jgi:hypothetical protein
MTNDKIGIENFKPLESFAYVAGFEYFRTRNSDSSFFEVGVFNGLFENYLLEVKDDVSNVFFNAGDGIEFVFNAVNFDRRDGVTFKRREEDSAQSVAHSDAIAGFQGFELELAVEVVCFEHEHFVGLLEC